MRQLGARKLTKGHASCLQGVLRGQLFLGRRPEGKIIFNTWRTVILFFYIVRVLDMQQFGPRSRSKEIDKRARFLPLRCPRRPERTITF
jgi:hypothetical protein